MTGKPLLLPIAISTALLASCTPIKTIRTASPTDSGSVLEKPRSDTEEFESCRTGRAVAGERTDMIETYADYLISYAEFDDQGWAYQNDRQLEQLKKTVMSEIGNKEHDNTDYLVLVFVHGWHHNVHDNDCNVQEFRQMVRIASEEAKKATERKQLQLPRRVIGIYVGWRGESVDAAGLRYTTVIDRRDTAERVAKGSVRKPFADLHDLQRAAETVREDKMRTVVIGHSFGGLIAFSALSQGLIDDFTLAHLEAPHDCTTSEAKTFSPGKSLAWPDGLVLINPAFEATRYEPIYRVIARRIGCTPAKGADARVVVPNMIVVTAENERWTGQNFTVGRALTTLFEGCDRTDARATDNERATNLHSIGFDPRYQTRELKLVTDDHGTRAVAYILPTQSEVPNSDTPIWVLRASSSVINGYNVFLFARPNRAQAPVPHLAEWMMHVYSKDCSVAPQMTGCERGP
jgi:pimeloyl-ACP methyl ester carboxylesterase